MRGLRLGLGLSAGGGAAPPFSISFTGLLTDSLGAYAAPGSHASVGYTITPDLTTETVKWSNSANPADAATYGTGASPTDFTASDGATVYLHVTDDPVDDPDLGPITRTFSFGVRYAPGAFGALSNQSFTEGTGNQTYVFSAATGSNLTWTYGLVSPPSGVTIDGDTRTVTFNTATLEVQAGTSFTVRATDQYGRTIDQSATFAIVADTGSAAFSTLHEQDWLTANEMHLDGVYWLRPFDLEAMGTPGQTIAAERGRYVWLVSSDHHNAAVGFAGGGGIWAGYSSDPGVLPTNWSMIIPFSVTTGVVTGPHNQMETPWLVYNPDDATYPFYVYGHGNTAADATRDQETLLFKSDDLLTFQTPVISHSSIQTGGVGHTGYQIVYRNGTGDWFSLGLGELPADRTPALWESTDGVTFTKIRQLSRTSGSGRKYSLDGIVTYDSVQYTVGRDDDRTALGTMAGSLAPAEADWDITATADADAIRVTNEWAGTFPSDTYVQAFSSYLEDGILHGWLRRGYFSSQTAPNKNDWTDYYTVLIDETAAASAAPAGVRASCASGVVTLNWYDALPHKNYRVARSSSASGPWTDLADVNAITYTDNSPTADAVNYYRVTTLNGGEQGSRITSTYAGNYAALTNAHITRALAAGAEEIDADWIDDVVGWLDTQGLTDNVVSWMSPSFGVHYATSPAVDKIFDLGATIHPFKYRDTVVDAGTWNYEASGIESVPAVNPSATASRLIMQDLAPNLIRQKDSLTVAALYQPKATSVTSNIFGMANTAGVRLSHNHSTGAVTWYTRTSSEVSATNTASGTTHRFVAGTWKADGEAIAYVDGTGGAPAAANIPGQPATGWLGAGDGQIPHPAVGDINMRFVPDTKEYLTSSAVIDAKIGEIMIFDTALSDAQIAALDTLVRGRVVVLPAVGNFDALSNQQFEKDTGNQTYVFSAATGTDLTWTYALTSPPAGVTIDSATRTITFDTNALALQTDTAITVTATDQYGRPATGSPRTFNLDIVETIVPFDPADLFGASEAGFFFDFTTTDSYTDTGRTTNAVLTNTVAGVTDLSGNNQHATQSTSGNRPTIQETGGGLQHLVFDGTDDHLVVTVNMTGVTAGTFWAVISKDGDVDDGRLMGNDISGGAFKVLAPISAANTAYRLRVTRTDNNGERVADSASTYAAPDLAYLTGWVNGDNSANPSVVLRRNGSQVGTQTSTVLWSGLGSQTWRIGNQQFGNEDFQGKIFAIGFIGRLLTAGELSDLETWCATRGGI